MPAEMVSLPAGTVDRDDRHPLSRKPRGSGGGGGGKGSVGDLELGAMMLSGFSGFSGVFGIQRQTRLKANRPEKEGRKSLPVSASVSEPPGSSSFFLLVPTSWNCRFSLPATLGPGVLGTRRACRQ